jgi:hypothetical protein
MYKLYFKEKNCEFEDLRKFYVRKLQKNRKSKIRKVVNLRNLTNYVSPQICGFAICGTYLRTAHLCFLGSRDRSRCGALSTSKKINRLTSKVLDSTVPGNLPEGDKVRHKQKQGTEQKGTEQ